MIAVETIQVGDWVEIDPATSLSRDINNAPGRVIAVEGAAVYVDFEIRKAYFHNLSGRISTDTGYVFSADELKKVTPPENNDFAEAIKDSPMMLTIGQKVYNLTKTNNIAASQILAERELVLATSFNSLKAGLERKLAEAKWAVENTIVCPSFSIKQLIQSKIQVTAESGALNFLLPITYAPKYVVKKNSAGQEERYLISEDFQQKLKIECFMQISFSKSKFRHVLLRRADGNMLYHYHCRGDYDCTGTLPVASLTPTLDSIVKFRDTYQSTLQTINKDSLASYGGSDGLPNVEEIMKKSSKVSSMDTWIVSSDTLAIGQLVKIMSEQDQFPSSWVGTIGKIISIRQSGDVNYLVEFGFSFPLILHAGDEHEGAKSSCYYFSSEKLAPAPPGRRRNRVPIDQGSEEES